MAGSGNRSGSTRSAGGIAAPSKRAGLTAVQRASRRSERLTATIGFAARQLDRLSTRRKAIVRQGPYSQSLDRRIARRQGLMQRLQSERGQIQLRDAARLKRYVAIRDRRHGGPDRGGSGVRSSASGTFRKPDWRSS